jgi:hypothetical protein
MQNSAYEQTQARKAKARLCMLSHAQRVSGNVSQTCRFFGASRESFYIWKKRYKEHGVASSAISNAGRTRSGIASLQKACL